MALQKDRRTGIFQFRKVIPEPLRPIFGKREYKVSLGTRDLAQAKVRMLGPAAEYERLLEDARTRRRNEAIETRSRVIVGDAALRYASRHQSVRNLIATAIQESAQEDVRRRLAQAIHGEPPHENTPFNDAWDRWERLRSLNQKIESAWAGLELLLLSALDASDEVYDEVFNVIDRLVAEWEKMMATVHPIGRLMRVTSPK